MFPLRLPITFFFFLVRFSLISQAPQHHPSGSILQKLKKLNVLGSILYVAAHPDDENTALISYLANGMLLRTAYLSATRGDGGQNLIGSEIREELGLIRTQELLAARRTDGGLQFFSRANDFGYSKNADETFNFWERDQVLSDFVRVYRKFKPDIVITRFSKEPPNHGHHTASAILALEAYQLSNKPNAFPDQITEGLEYWQAKKIFWNTSWFFFRRRGIPFDTTGLNSIDVGKYNPNIGLSYTEISALSRSMHKSQGFGTTGQRGFYPEYFVQWEGSRAKDMFADIDFSWSRVEESQEVAQYLRMAEDNYDPEDPLETLTALEKGRIALSKLPDQFWKRIKLQEIDEIIGLIYGLYLEVTADEANYTAGDSITLNMESISRSLDGMELLSVRLLPWDKDYQLNTQLDINNKIIEDYSFRIPVNMPLSQPYWLNGKASKGMYYVKDPTDIGTAENTPDFVARFLLKWRNQYLEYDRQIVFKTNDPVAGEVYEPVAIVPRISVTPDNNIIVFDGINTAKLKVDLKAGATNQNGHLQIQLPEGWTAEPSKFEYSFDQKGEEKNFQFTISPSRKPGNYELSLLIDNNNGRHTGIGTKSIEYNHIPKQYVFKESKVSLVNIDLKKAGNRIGYIKGAGDLVAKSLSMVGYEVDFLNKEDVTLQKLMVYDAIVLGVRAFNTVDWLVYKNQELFDYAKEGGTVIVQYNTTRGLKTDKIAPYELLLSRDRVTMEDAEIRVLAPDHPVMNFPNKITSSDFNGWVQERGLYFSDKWDESFTPVLSSNDLGELPKNGGLLVARHGKGYYVYTGYSWFRELPAGVPGAYRLFVNMLSLGKN